MPLVALGVNHNTAPVAFRERVSFQAESLPAALRELRGCPGVHEAAILSTCNRTDLYCGTVPGERHHALQWFQDYHRLSHRELDAHVYAHRSELAARHIMRVASGLDSLVLGEPQILGQVKTAYRAAKETGTLGLVLDKLFQHAFAAAKRVRTDTAIAESPVSVAFAAVALARQIFGDLGHCTAMLLGAGETMELAARHLSAQGLGRMIVANRTLTNGLRLAQAHGGYAIGLDEVETHLHEADVVIASTGSPEPVITLDQARRAVRARKRRPIFMVDIAVPQDVDPAVRTLEDVYLYTVDDLRDVVEENRRSRQGAAVEAEEIVTSQVGRFMGWLGTRSVAETICAVRQGAEAERDEVLARALAMVARGRDPAQAMRYLAHTLTNKLMHGPTVQIRHAGAGDRTELITAARALFELDDDGPRGASPRADAKAADGPDRPA